MNMLYKRFFIVALLIASTGIFIANLIQNTRTDSITTHSIGQIYLFDLSCTGEKSCSADDFFIARTLIG